MSTSAQKNAVAICGFNEDSLSEFGKSIFITSLADKSLSENSIFITSLSSKTLRLNHEFWSRGNLACSSGSLGKDMLFSSLGQADIATSSDALHVSGFSLIGSSASLGALLHSMGDFELEANFSFGNDGHMPSDMDTEVQSLWSRSNDDGENLTLEASTHRVTSKPEETLAQMDADIAPSKQPKQSSKQDDNGSLNSKATKRHIRSNPKNTLAEIDADIAISKRPKKSLKRDGNKSVTSKAGKRRVRSKRKKSFVQPAKQPKKTSKRCIRKWTKEEDARLEEGVKLFKIPHWSKIAKHVKTRTNKMCAQRWRYTLRPEIKSIKKGSWSKDEDQKLKDIASEHKIKNERAWSKISESMGFTRSNIQCRERWINFLDPTLNLGPWTTEEDARLMSLYKERGNCWKKMTLEIVGRSAMHIRRRFDYLKSGVSGRRCR